MGHLKPRQQASKYGIQEKTGNRQIMCMYDKTRGEIIVEEEKID